MDKLPGMSSISPLGLIRISPKEVIRAPIHIRQRLSKWLTASSLQPRGETIRVIIGGRLKIGKRIGRFLLSTQRYKGYEGSQKDRASEVRSVRRRAERLRLFFKKMVEGSLLCSSNGVNCGYLERRMWFMRAAIMLKAPQILKTMKMLSDNLMKTNPA